MSPISDTATVRKDILEHTLHGIIMSDIEGKITYWNRACEKIFGYSRHEVIGRSSEMLYYGSDQDYSFKKILTQFKAGKPFAGQWRGRHKNNSSVWLDVRSNILKDKKGNPEAYLVSVCDIKPLKKMESELERIRAVSEAIVESSVDAFITIDENGKILSFNKAAEDMFGFSFVEAVGKDINILMPEPHRANNEGYIFNYPETGEKKIIGTGRELHAMKKDGTVFPVELSVTEVKWKDSRIFSGIIKDISERRKFEKRILEISDQERMRIGQDLHDGLGQMLTGIRMVSENLARKLKANGVPGADEVQGIAEMVKEADEHARAISHGLAHIFFDRNGIHVAFRNLCKKAEKMFNITCDCTIAESPLIENHNLAVSIYRIVQEAINNAVKHGKAKNIEIRLAANDRHIFLSIEDDGNGLYDGFDMEDNMGMGIRIMKHRAGLLGGILDISESKSGRTRVRCLLPKDTIQF